MQNTDKNTINWNSSQLNQLLGQGLDRLPHAMLLVGPPGIGKGAFSEQLAALLLCEAADAETGACGRCPACRWLAAGNHPDFRRIAPDGEEEGDEAAAEKTKKKGPGSIRIDQIRDLEDFVFVGSHRHGRRVVLVTNAEAMNSAAANALLKILEEPPSTVYFILVSSKTKSLLPTIRSRCRVIPFARPDAAQATTWLASAGLSKEGARYLGLAGGAPLRVEQWKEEGQLSQIDALIDSLASPGSDPLALAGRWDSLLKTDGPFRLEQLVEEVQRWMFDLAQERIAGEIRYHGGWPRPKGVASLDPHALLAAWRDLQPFRRSAKHPLNQLLFLESLATQVLRALRPSAA